MGVRAALLVVVEVTKRNLSTEQHQECKIIIIRFMILIIVVVGNPNYVMFLRRKQV